MTLTLGSVAPEVGESLWITATLANEGCASVGQPEYRLWVEQPSLIFVPDSPTSVTHSLALNTGETDTVTFSLRTVGFGEASLRVSASFEVHLEYPGPAYWGYHSTAPITVNVPITDTEVAVLHQAMYDMGCFPNASQVTDGAYTLGCAERPIEAQIERFADAEATRAEFTARRGDSPPERFHCYPAYRRTEPESPPQQTWHSWMAERWLITTHSVDDPGTPVALALTLSEAVYRAAFRNHLFAACDRVYLPIICKP
jgi:hypothetical protein